MFFFVKSANKSTLIELDTLSIGIEAVRATTSARIYMYRCFNEKQNSLQNLVYSFIEEN